MTKKTLLILIFITTFAVCIGLEYPNDFYVTDTEKKLNIVLGTPILYLQKNYGSPKEIQSIWKYESNYYELWKHTFENFYVYTDSNSNMVRFFSTSNPNYQTSRGIKCGDKLSSVIEKYGNPTYKTDKLVMYVNFFQEINLQSESTIIGFYFDENENITKIYMTIDISV